MLKKNDFNDNTYIAENDYKRHQSMTHQSIQILVVLSSVKHSYLKTI